MSTDLHRPPFPRDEPPAFCLAWLSSSETLHNPLVLTHALSPRPTVIPVKHLLKAPHSFLQATVVGLSPTHASLLLPSSTEPVSLPFRYCVYALGGSLPSPIDLSLGLGSKAEGVERLSVVRARVEQVGTGGRITVIGGGALGIQMATDIKEVFSDRKVTLLHSREQVLPAFHRDLHDAGQSCAPPPPYPSGLASQHADVVRAPCPAAIDRLDELKIKYILGERAILPPQGYNDLSTHAKVVSTVTGRLIPSDLIVRPSRPPRSHRTDVLTHLFPSPPVFLFPLHRQLTCTGQVPLSQHLIPHFTSSVNPSNKKIRVLPTTQIADGPGLVDPVEGGRLFAVGDCCETEAILAGYSASCARSAASLSAGLEG